jgi:hypothetical protein
MEMPLGDIGSGLVPRTGALPVATTEDNFLQTNAGHVVVSQHKDGNVVRLLTIHAHNFIYLYVVL